MWGKLLILSLIGHSMAVPAPQQDNGDLSGLINSVFGPAPQNESQNQLAMTTPTTILGTQNMPGPLPDDCECVPYFQCSDGRITTNGMGLIDIRSGFGDNNTSSYFDTNPGIAGVCENYLNVCCKPPDRLEPGMKVTPPPTKRRGCGHRNVNGVGFRITGDNNSEAQFGEFPWMVAVLKEEIIGDSNQKLPVYQCGGSLIHKQAVLTAAHCFQGKRPVELKIRAGEWDTQTKNEVFPHQDRNIQEVIVHNKFHAGALYNDFAILILTEPVEIAENVDIACLPDPTEVFDGRNCFASGWGKNMFGKEGVYQMILKKVELPVVSHDSCQNSLRKSRLGKYFDLHDSFICAGGETGKDTCKGDGGSPLVCPSKSDRSRYLQAGIVAWGIGCGEDGTPGVYSNVAYARDWINEQMAFYNLDNTVYQLTAAA